MKRRDPNRRPMGGKFYTGTVYTDGQGRVISVKPAEPKCVALQPTTGFWASKLLPWNWGK